MPKNRRYTVKATWQGGDTKTLGFVREGRAEAYAAHAHRFGAAVTLTDTETGVVLLELNGPYPVALPPERTQQRIESFEWGGPMGGVKRDVFTAGAADFAAEWIDIDGNRRLGGFVRFTGSQPGGGSIPTPSATPPASPTDGTLWVFPADAANGINWLFEFNSSEATFKWEFLGGQPMMATVDTQETTASNVYIALATAGPSITVARQGDYVVHLGSLSFNSTAAGAISAHSYDIGGTGAVDADALIPAFGGAANQMEVHSYRPKVKTNLAAGTALVSKYRTTAGTGTWGNRWIQVLPRRVI
jgi:hypothetical protein